MQYQYLEIVCGTVYFDPTPSIVTLCLVFLNCVTCTALFLEMTWIAAHAADRNGREYRNLKATSMAEIDIYLKRKMRKKAIRCNKNYTGAQ